MMISEPIHTEVICKIKIRKKIKIDENLIEQLIEKVERIESFVTGTSDAFVLSAYRKDVKELNLIDIVNEYISENITLIKDYKISIRYR